MSGPFPNREVFNKAGGPALAASIAEWVGTRILFLLVFSLVVSSIHAQVTTADLLGTVTDPSGAVIPHAQITVKNLDTNATHSAVSDDAGDYTVRLLPAGHYSLVAEASGFQKLTIQNLSLSIGDRLREDLHLQVGSATQSVEVIANATAVHTDESNLSTLVTSHAMQDLPLNGRDFVVLAQFAPGANEGYTTALPSGNRPDDRRMTSAVAVNAQNPSYNNFLLDGLDDNERYIGTVIIKPSVDALEEMKVESNLYSAELGRTGGAVVNFITKSGTNTLHGTAFEYLRNQVTDAKNFFSLPGPTPPYKQNQFGGSLGGPIRKDKTFFFGDYEGLRIRQAQSFTSTVPTAAEQQGNFSGVSAIFDPLSTVGNTRTRFPNDTIPASRFDPAGKALAALYPLPLTSGLVNNFTINPVKTQDADIFDIRVDEVMSGGNSLYGRYSYNKTTTFLPGGLPVAPNGINPIGDEGYSGTSPQRAQSAEAKYVHVFGSHLVLELATAYNRYATQTTPENYGINASTQIGIPGANVDLDSSGLVWTTVTGLLSLGDDRNLPMVVRENMFQESGSLVYNRGGHSIKFGGDLRRRQLSVLQSTISRGYFTINTSLTNDPSGATPNSGNAIATLQLGYPAQSQRTKYLVWPGYRILEYDGYFQDDWHITRRLTLNLGIRYEYSSPISEVCNRISDANLVTGKILVAGQNGVSDNVGLHADRHPFAPRFGFAATLDPKTVLRGGFGINYVPPFMGTMLAFRLPPWVSLWNISASSLTPLNKISDGLPYPSPTDPNNPQGNLNIDALDFTTPYVMQYNLTLERQVPGGMIGSASYSADLGRKQEIFDGGAPVNYAPPGPGAVAPREPYYPVWPGVGTITDNKTVFNANYHSLQTKLERRFSRYWGLLGTYTYAHIIDNEGVMMMNYYQRGDATIDMRHRFTLTVEYEPSFAKNTKGLVGALGKGWRLNLAAVAATGVPIDISNSSAQSNTGGSDRPNQVGPLYPSGFTQNVQHWFNTAAFALQPLYTFGDFGRDVIHAPGHAQADLSLHREFPVKERMRLEFRAECYNLSNRANFGAPGTSFGTSTFGVISSALPARQFQFALKLLF